jgi:hypothetical protein
MAKNKTHTVSVKANKIKISTTITGLDILLETMGDAVKLKVDVDGVFFTVPINPKSFRKAQAALKDGEPGTVIVVLTGELDLTAKMINAAGIVAQTKLPKPITPTEDAGSETPIEHGQAFIAIEPPSPIIIIKKQRIPEPQVDSI